MRVGLPQQRPKLLPAEDGDQLQSLPFSYRIGSATGGVADVGGLERTDVNTKLIELAALCLELALHCLESALSGRGEISELLRQVEQFAGQQPLA